MLNDLFRVLVKSATTFIGLVVSIGTVIKDVTGQYEDFNEVTQKQNDLRVLSVIENKRATASAEGLLKSYEDLNGEENLTIEQKEELSEVQDDLINLYGRSAASIDEETGELILNVRAIRAKIAAQRALESKEASILLQEEAKINARRQALKTEREGIDILNETKKILTELSDGTTFSTDIDVFPSLLDAAERGSASFKIELENIKRT